MSTAFPGFQYQLVNPIEGQIQRVNRTIDTEPGNIVNMTVEEPEYLAWLAEGNTPLPPDAPPTE